MNFDIEKLNYSWDWIASDKYGNIASLGTVACGPVPKTLLLSPNIETDDFEEFMKALPKSSEVKFSNRIQFPDMSEYVDIASRGIFSFDFADYPGSMRPEVGGYEIIARPVSPMSILDLPPHLKIITDTAMFDKVDFSTLEVFNPEDYCECLQGRWPHQE